nr:GNAT family N-acetyltransferase [Maritimibacter sp. DP1N21-5]
MADDWIGEVTPDLERAEADYARMLAEGVTQLFVARDETGVTATYQLSVVWGVSLTASCRAILEAVRVRRDLRGQGIGRELVADAEARARAAGATMIQLTSNQQREAAHRFYAGLGYLPSHVGMKKPLA